MTLRQKILARMYLLMVLLVSAMSLTYFYLFTKDVQERSQQAITTAFALVFDDVRMRTELIASKLDYFVQTGLLNQTYMINLYREQRDQSQPIDLWHVKKLMPYLSSIAFNMREFSEFAEASQIVLYDQRGRLLALYRRNADAPISGAYLEELKGGTFVELRPKDHWPALAQTLDEIPAARLPEGVSLTFQDAIPEQRQVMFHTLQSQLAIEFRVPFSYHDTVLGVCVLHLAIGQEDASRYARLSGTEINLFAGQQLTAGTLPFAALPKSPAADARVMDVLTLNMPSQTPIRFDRVQIGGHAYYQGSVLIGQPHQPVGAISIYYPRRLEEIQRRRFLWLALGITFVFSVFAILEAVGMSGAIVRPIHRLASAMKALQSGQFEIPVLPTSHDEIGFLSSAFTQMWQQLKENFEALRAEIRERERVENALRESEARYRSLFDRVPVGLYRTTPEGKILDANLAFAQLLSYPSREALLAHTSPEFYVDPQDRVIWKTLMAQAGVVRDFEVQWRRADGATIWVKNTGRAIRDAQGEIAAYEGSLEDITDRKRAEEEVARYWERLEEQVKERTAELRKEIAERQAAEDALKASETEYRLLFENLQDLFFRVTDDGIVLLVSPSIILMLGHLPETAIGQPITEYIVANPQQWEQFAAAIRTRGFLNGFELLLKHDNGAQFWGSVSAQMYRDDASGRYIFEGTIRDISERKRAEAELQAKNADLRETLTHLQAAQQELIQAEKMAALGKLIANIAHEINTPLGAIRASAGNILSALDATFQSLPEVIRQLSEEQSAAFIRLIQRACQPKQALTSKEERQRRRALTHLLEEAAVAQADTIADTLVDMGIDDEIEAFTPLFRHEKTLWLLGAAANVAAQRHSSENILFAVERMSKIVFALKSYAHVDASGRPTLARIQDGMEVVLTLYHNQLKHGIEVVKQYDAAPPISCYPDELQQVWTNLIHNAVHAMRGKGRLEITVKPTPCPSEEGKQSTPLLGGAGGGSGILVEIADSGCGIPPEITDRIFEPFFTTKPAGEGSGMGLDICKKILDKHQGRIEFESQPGRTTFRVYLPSRSIDS